MVVKYRKVKNGGIYMADEVVAVKEQVSGTEKVAEKVLEKEPQMKLSQSELENLREMVAEGQKLQTMNAQLDMQKQQLLQELNNNVVTYQRFSAKVQKKFNLPQGAAVDLDINTGVVTVKSNQIMGQQQ